MCNSVESVHCSVWVTLQYVVSLHITLVIINEAK